MSCVPPSAATAASKRPPSRSPSTSSLLGPLATDDPWLAAVEVFATRNPRRRDRIDDYLRLLDAGTHLLAGEAVGAGTYRPQPPTEAWLNKADGRKKRIFQYPPLDELLFRAVNRLLQPAAMEAASPWCRSFLPGGGARAAFRGVLADGNVDTKAALRLDVRDYFNSIDVDDLLAGVPDVFAHDEPVTALLAAALRDQRVVRNGVVVDDGAKGVMAGTPLAPLLATLYLRDIDAEVAGAGVTYARYSDDIIALAEAAELPEVEALIRRRLGGRGLRVNESKSGVAAAGEPWDFLGFRYHQGSIALSPLTERKLKARTTRLARSLLRWRERNGASGERTLGAYLRRTNRRLYGVPTERSQFSWATWFLPMLGRADGLEVLDAHVQREARYAASGRRRAAAKRSVPYAALLEAGYLPLVSAYWAVHDDRHDYDDVVARRTGLGNASNSRICTSEGALSRAPTPAVTQT